MSKTSEPTPHRFLICCDGTWQTSVTDRDNIPSNITRLARAFAPLALDKKTSKLWRQIVYYDAGVGTGDDGGWFNIEGMRRGGTGDGLNENVLEAYNFLVNNYRPGDEICCFGFSRGAYTARAVAGLVTEIGIVSPLMMDYFPALYRQFMARTGHDSFRTTTEFREFCAHQTKVVGDNWLSDKGPPSIKVVGVFDTVGALGVPDIGGFSLKSWRQKYQFHNTSLNSSIENAFHALALDERRKPFGPTLWHKDNTTTNLQQCWFPGVHINIGGGSDDQLKTGEGDQEEIATLTLAWMIDRCSPFIAFKPEAIHRLYLEHAILTHDPSVTVADKRHETRSMLKNPPHTWGQYAKSFFVDVPPNPLPAVGYASGPIIDSFSAQKYTLQVSTGSETRTPGAYKAQKVSKSGETETAATSMSSASTGESIHPSVWARRLATVPAGEDPSTSKKGHQFEALRGFTRKRLPGSGYHWVNGDGTSIPEHCLSYRHKESAPGEIFLERQLIQGLLPEFLADLDRANNVTHNDPCSSYTYVEPQILNQVVVEHVPIKVRTNLVQKV